MRGRLTAGPRLDDAGFRALVLRLNTRARVPGTSPTLRAPRVSVKAHPRKESSAGPRNTASSAGSTQNASGKSMRIGSRRAPEGRRAPQRAGNLEGGRDRGEPASTTEKHREVVRGHHREKDRPERRERDEHDRRRTALRRQGVALVAERDTPAQQGRHPA